MQRLIELFESIAPLSANDRALIVGNTYLESLRKGEIYCEPGRVCKKMGFVLEGVFKVVRCDAGGDEFIQYFTSEGHFSVDLESFSNQTPGQERIQALTPCSVITITHEKFRLFEQSIPAFSGIIGQLKEQALLAKYLIKSEMLVDDALTRYEKLMQRNPSIIRRVPQSQIASFLGVTQYTLSRIRARR